MKRNVVPALLCSLSVLGWTQSPQAAPSPISQIVEPERSEGISTEYGVGTAVVGTLNVACVMNNTGDHGPKISRTWGYMGVMGGVLGMTLGGVGLAEGRSHEENSLAIVNLGLGAVAAVSGVLAIKNAHGPQPPEPAVIGEMPVHFGAGVIGGHQPGLGVQLTF
jgi:hypothetical protein